MKSKIHNNWFNLTISSVRFWEEPSRVNFPRHGTSILIAFMLLLLPHISRADFFKYKDDGGNLTITNRLEDVPKKYRNRVIVVWDKDLAAKDPLARRQAAAREQLEQQETAKKSRQQAEEKKRSASKEKTLVIEFDEISGQLIRRFE